MAAVKGAAAAAAAAAVVALPLSLRGISLGDEGHLMAIADRLARGDGVLYRDIATNVPPLCYETLAAAFRLFGTTLVVERLLGVALCAAMAAGCYRLGARSGGPRAGALTVLAFLGVKGLAFPHWNLFYYTEAALTLSVWALALAAEAGAVGGPRAWLPPGVLLALAFGFKQNFALFAAIAIGAHLFRTVPRPWRALALLALPSIALATLFVGQAAWSGALAAFLDWNVGYYFGRFGADLAIPYPRLLPRGALWPGQPLGVALFYYLPPFAAGEPALFAALAARPRAAALVVRLVYLLPLLALVAALRRRAEPLAVFALLSLLALAPLADFSHLLDALLPSALLLASPGLGHGRGRGRGATIALLALAAIGAGSMARQAARLDTPVTLGAAGRVWVTAAQARQLGAVTDALARFARPGDPILALPYCPLLYVSGPYRNPTCLYLPFPSLFTPERQREIEEAAAPVQVLVRGGGQWPHLPRFEEAAPRLAAYLEDEFEVVERIEGFEIAVRRGARETTPGGAPSRSRRSP